MPIVVRHGGQGGTAAGQIIAQSGLANLQLAHRDAQLAAQLRQQRDLQITEINARADLQKQAASQAMARTALQHGLDGQLREEEFARTMTRMQEQAKLQAQQWEYQYTAQQRQEIARFNNARQTIQSSRHFSPEEKSVALAQIDLQQSNIKPSMMPRDPSKPLYPEGQGVGEAWVDQNGSVVGRKPDGSLQLIQRFDQGPEAHQLKMQAAREDKALELAAKREEKLLELRLKLATESIDQTGADGKVTGSRTRTPQEIDAIMESVTGERSNEQPGEKQPAPWWSRPENKGMQVTEGDKQLPPQVGYAQAYVRQMNAKYGGFSGIPQDVRRAYLEAAKVLQQYAATEQ